MADIEALLALRDMLEAGEIDAAGYDAAAARLGEAAEAIGAPPGLTAEDSPPDDAARDGEAEAGTEGKAMDMADDDTTLGQEADAAPAAIRPHGYEALSRAHKGLHAWRKSVEADMPALDNADVREHLSQHLDGTAKALKAMKMACRKAYKDHDELPDDYGEEPEIETKDVSADDMGGGMSAEDATAGGALLGERPEGEGDEPDGDEVSDEDAEYMAKSLPALKRQLGLL